MKRIVALALAVAVAGLAGMAEAEDCGKISACGDMYGTGLEFGFSGLSNIGVSPVQTGTIGVKKAMGEGNFALLRAGFGISRDKTDASQSGCSDDKDGSMRLGLAGGVQHNLGCCGNCLVPYVGGLASLSYYRTTSEPEVCDNDPAGTLTKKTTSTKGLGLTAIVGAEYFFKKCMSLSGEYTFGFGYSGTTTKDEKKDADTVESSSSNFYFGPFSAAGVRLTVYFD